MLLLAFSVVTPASANCASWPWHEAYSPDRCWLDGDTIFMRCAEKYNSANCGMRLEAGGNGLGAGTWSQTIQAAPGKGAVTSYYLSNNGGMYSMTQGWNEIDFEIFGGTAKNGGSKIWTNLFTGLRQEHAQVITVPFNTMAGFHTYSFHVTPTTVQWLVDGIVYRTMDVTPFGDVKWTVNNHRFRPYLSLWGKTWSDPKVGVSRFRNLQGMLNDNKYPFPLFAKFKRKWNPHVGLIRKLRSASKNSTWV